MADRLVLEMMGEDMKMFDVEQVKALNDLERMVYEYVVKDPEKVKYMRIRELADEVHVSTSTILRFCKKWDVAAIQNLSCSFGIIRPGRIRQT